MYSFRPIIAGCAIFILQIGLVLSLCPEKNWGEAWLSLASHWDSEWYAAIAQYGYVNLDGPTHCGLKNANVVFFPGYPYLARGLVLSLHLQAKTALLLVSQTAALLFWCSLFYILRQLSWLKQSVAALLISVFPTSWFLVMGYSESLFILSCCLSIYWIIEKRWLYSGIMSMLMTATRLIGLPVLAVPFFTTCLLKFPQIRMAMQKANRNWLYAELIQPTLFLALGALGCIGFFVYCALHFGSWHLYFDMERLHWSGTADPAFLLQRPTWIPPPWGYSLDKAPPLPNIWSKILPFDFLRLAAYSFSELLVPIFMWLGIGYAYYVFKTRRLRDVDMNYQHSLTWFVAGFLILLFTCFSLATRHYESMSRCLLPVWILWVIGGTLYTPRPGKGLITKAIVLLIWVFFSLSFWLEMLSRYCLGWWVA